VIYDRDEEADLAHKIHDEIGDKVVEGRYSHIHVTNDPPKSFGIDVYPEAKPVTDVPEGVKKTVAEIIQIARGFPSPVRKTEFKDFEKTDKGYRASGSYEGVVMGNFVARGFFDIELDKDLRLVRFRIDELK